MIEVSGTSDDLIEVEGDIREEFTALSDGPDGSLLAFSDGTVLRIAYTDAGVWRITPLLSSRNLTITQAPEDDEDNYSDRAVLNIPVAWVVLGSEIARPEKRG